MNRDFNNLESRRKTVKSTIMTPYQEFEKIYKQCISSKYNATDLLLKEKIQSVENEIKDRKRNELAEYFNEYAQSKKIEFDLTLSDAKIDVKLSDSLKALKQQARLFIDMVSEDLEAIKQEQYASEIMLEYRRTFNRLKAITVITNWHAELDRVQQRKQQQTQAREIVKAVIDSPEEEKTLIFTVTATITKLKELKNFLIEGKYSFN